MKKGGPKWEGRDTEDQDIRSQGQKMKTGFKDQEAFARSLNPASRWQMMAFLSIEALFFFFPELGPFCHLWPHPIIKDPPNRRQEGLTAKQAQRLARV